MPTKQLWKITIDAVETEGQNTTVPWYNSGDVVQLLRTVLNDGHANTIRDMKISGIKAEPIDKPFFE